MARDERDQVVAAARRLGAIPDRDKRWIHLPLCVLDSVFSKGARYGGTSRTVYAYAELAVLTHVVGPADEVAAGAFSDAEQPVSELRDRIDRHGPDEFARQVHNRQRTSTRGGILKAAAAHEFAAVLAEHDL